MRLLVVVLALAARVAAAHTGSNSYAEIRLDERDVGIALQIAHADWLAIVDLDADRDGALTREEVQARLPRLGAYVRARLRVTADDLPCNGAPVDADSGGGFDRTLTLVRMNYHCPAPIRTVTITSALFAREHPGHRTFAIVRDATGSSVVRQHVFGPGSETLALTLDAPAGRAAARGLFELGIRQFLALPDHVLVLLALLLAAGGMRDVAKIAAAFAVAYSAPLALAALGVVAPHDRTAAIATALTLIFVGLANVAVPRYAGRWPIALVCGVVHGFSFATGLGELGVTRSAMTFAAFNAGIEAGVLVALCLIHPVLAWLGARPAGSRAVHGMSVGLVLVGLSLLAERALFSS